MIREEAEVLATEISRKAERLGVPFTAEQISRLTHACQKRENWDPQIMAASERAKKTRVLCVSCRKPKEVDGDGICRDCRIS